MAVVRVDGLYLEGQRPAYRTKQGELAACMICEIVTFTHPQGLQIDFEAPREAWPFYRKLLTVVRARAGDAVRGVADRGAGARQRGRCSGEFAGVSDGAASLTPVA